MSDDKTKMERMALMATEVTSAEFRDQMSPALGRACREVADGLAAGLASVDISLSADVVLALVVGATAQAATATSGAKEPHNGLAAAIALLAVDVLEGNA